MKLPSLPSNTVVSTERLDSIFRSLPNLSFRKDQLLRASHLAEGKLVEVVEAVVQEAEGGEARHRATSSLRQLPSNSRPLNPVGPSVASLSRKGAREEARSPRDTCATPVVGARLLNHLAEWRSITSNRFVLEIVGRGLSLTFKEQPLLSSDFLPFSLPRVGSEKRGALLDEIRKMIDKQAVVPVQQGTPGFYCNLFLVTKATGGFRPVINLKPLNQMMINPSFKMETASSIMKALSPRDWVVSIDLKDAYFHLPVRPDYQHYLRFAVSDTEAYQFRALTFGLCSAPSLFTMVLRELAQHSH